jgi:hypothetical protein
MTGGGRWDAGCCRRRGCLGSLTWRRVLGVGGPGGGRWKRKGGGTHLVGAWVVVVTGEGSSAWAMWRRGRWWWLAIGLWVVVDAQIEHRKIPTFNLGKEARVALSDVSLLLCNSRMV